MRVGTLIELLSKFDPQRPVTLMVPAHCEKIPIEVVQVIDGTFLPADSLVGRNDIVIIRSAQ